MRTNAVVVALSFVMAACSSTNYSQATSSAGYGFFEFPAKTDVWQVQYRGDRYVSSAKASDLAMLRAAQVALREGKRYFIVLEREDDVRTRGSYQRGQRRTEVEMTGYEPMTNTATGNATTTVTGGVRRTHGEPRSVVLVQLVNARFKGHSHQTYEADFVLRSVEEKYGEIE